MKKIEKSEQIAQRTVAISLLVICSAGVGIVGCDSTWNAPGYVAPGEAAGLVSVTHEVAATAKLAANHNETFLRAI